jgi:dTDP-4-amino-4,6-dideoxygalactose transaminase
MTADNFAEVTGQAMIGQQLAIDGGAPVRSAPFAPWPYFPQDEIEPVTRVLASGKVNYWTGEEGRNFEREFASHSGCRYAVALANGTVALELALYVLGIGSGDEVVVTARTFIASASCVIMRGATPVIADVDPDSQNVTAETIRAVLSPRTKAIIAVHLAGWPCDMDPILELARECGLKVIEDCAQCHGASYWGRPAGSLGDVAAFSFCQDKIMTTGGEGGMLTTNDPHLWEKAWAFKDHGKSWDAVYNRAHPPGFRWLHESFGTNWRLTEMQAAIGRVQLQKLPDWLRTRQGHAQALTSGFAAFPGLRVTAPPADFSHAYYKYYVFVRPERLSPGWDRDRIMAAINAEGIPCFSGSCSEIYLEKAFADAGLGPAGRLPVAKELGETSLMFQVHPTLAAADIEDTILAVGKVMAVASGTGP